MKIAFLVGQFPALSETFVLNQITGLIDRGHSVSIFAERHSSDARTHPDVDRYGLLRLTRYELLPAGAGERLAALPRIWRPNLPMLRALNVFRHGMQAVSLRLAWAANLFEGAPDFDIVQCHFGALGLKAVLLRQIGALRGAIVTSFHGGSDLEYPRRFRGNVYAPLFAGGDLFLPISALARDALVSLGCPADRIRIHRMGIDLRHFPSRESARATSGRMTIITTARLVEFKGISGAIQAVAKLPEAFEYVIVGDGPLRPELESLARTLSISRRVRFDGARTRAEVAASLSRADVFLLPSITANDGETEGIPVAIMEAMACGLPVISTRHGAIPELVADGVSGFLVKEHDIEDLAARLNSLAADPHLRHQMGLAGREIVAADFEIGRLNDRLVEMYRGLSCSDGSAGA